MLDYGQGSLHTSCWRCWNLELFKSAFHFKVCSDFAQSKIIEYLKLEGTDNDHQDQLPAGLAKTKPYT